MQRYYTDSVNISLEVILTSVVISGLVSGIFLFFNDWLRRKSEEKRTIFDTAAHLTELRQNQIIELIKRTNKTVLWPAALNTFEKTFKEVSDIWDGKYKKNNKPPQEA